VMLVGMLGEEPPTDDEGMLAYASRLSAPEIAEVLRKATPLDSPAKMRFAENSRKHFETLDRYLDGFIVVGDALCALNPVFGQGQTVAVLEAELLQSLLAAGRDDVSERFFTRVAEVLAEPWETATGEMPEYLQLFRAAAVADPELARAWVRVSMMLAPRSTLFTADLQERVRRSDT
jgi:2-polyprenyl-6-methoxyphenol hydroxylase-like FAD-dependent oxidoreductase